MSTQGTLSFYRPIHTALAQPIARKSDPETSHQAAREITNSGRHEGQLLAVLALVRKYPRHTSLELTRYTQFDRYILARRLPELEKAGMVRKGAARMCTVGRRNAVIWEAC